MLLEKINNAIPAKIWGLPLKRLTVSATLVAGVMGLFLKIRWKVIDILDFSAQKITIYCYRLISICSKSRLCVGLFWGIHFFRMTSQLTQKTNNLFLEQITLYVQIYTSNYQIKLYDYTWTRDCGIPVLLIC